MNDSNVLSEFNIKIEGLDKTINDMRANLARETLELDQMNNQILSLKSQYEMKKMSLSLMNSRLAEKTKLLLEAKNGYNRIISNMSRLMEVVNKEQSDMS